MIFCRNINRCFWLLCFNVTYLYSKIANPNSKRLFQSVYFVLMMYFYLFQGAIVRFTLNVTQEIKYCQRNLYCYFVWGIFRCFGNKNDSITVWTSITYIKQPLFRKIFLTLLLRKHGPGLTH